CRDERDVESNPPPFGSRSQSSVSPFVWQLAASESSVVADRCLHDCGGDWWLVDWIARVGGRCGSHVHRCRSVGSCVDGGVVWLASGNFQKDFRLLPARNNCGAG